MPAEPSYIPRQVYRPRYGIELFEDWNSNASTGSSGITSNVSGTASANTIDSTLVDGTRWGIISHVTGTTATGRAAVGWGISNMAFGNGIVIYEASHRIPTLSDAAQRYAFTSGIIDHQNTATADDAVDGAYFKYRDDIDGGRWHGVTSSNSTRSTTAAGAGPVVAINTWYRLRIVANAAGTSIEFFVDDSSIGSLTTNIPTTNARISGIGCKIQKSVGTTSRNVFSDYMYFRREFDSAR